MILSTIIFLVGMIALYEVESSTDKTYSELGQTEKQNRKWHRGDALYLAILGAIIIFGYFGITWASLFAISYIGLLRMSYFNIRLNMRRGKPLFYTGHFGKIKEVKLKHKSKIRGKVNSRTEYYYEITLEKNFKFNEYQTIQLQPKVLFEKNDKINKELLSKYLPTISTLDKVKINLNKDKYANA